MLLESLIYQFLKSLQAKPFPLSVIFALTSIYTGSLAIVGKLSPLTCNQKANTISCTAGFHSMMTDLSRQFRGICQACFCQEQAKKAILYAVLLGLFLRIRSSPSTDHRPYLFFIETENCRLHFLDPHKGCWTDIHIEPDCP
jgi:hypothetical protein